MKYSILQRLADRADLAAEALPGRPILELLGDERVLIENHGGISQYGSEKIQVLVRYGAVCICGRCLRLCQMNGPQLVITGKIDTISVVRREQ